MGAMIITLRDYMLHIEYTCVNSICNVICKLARSKKRLSHRIGVCREQCTCTIMFKYKNMQT